MALAALRGGSTPVASQPVMSRIALLLLLLAWSGLSVHAAQLRITGAVVDLLTGAPLAGVDIKVYRNGERVEVQRTGPQGRYQVLLDQHAEYVLRFSMPGMVSKGFTVDTRGAAWEKDRRVVEEVIDMQLFAPVEGLDHWMFDRPMGMAHFIPMTGLLTWDAAYDAQIRAEVNRYMAAWTRQRQVLLADLHRFPAQPSRN